MKRYIATTTMEDDRYYLDFAQSFVDELATKCNLDTSKITINPDVDYAPVLEAVTIDFSELHIRLTTIELRFCSSNEKISSSQGWTTGVWLIYFPRNIRSASPLVNELLRKSTFQKYLVPKKVVTWPGSRLWNSVDVNSEKFDDMWQEWLSSPESEVNSELNVFTEPSIQGGYGDMFIFDTSTKPHEMIASVDFSDWCESELMLASQSKSRDDFKHRYKSYLSSLIC